MTKKFLAGLAVYLCFALLPTAAWAAEIKLDISAGSIVINKGTYTVGDKSPINYGTGTVFTVFGRTSENTITVSSGVTANITLGNRTPRTSLLIDVSGRDKCAFDIASGATVNLTLYSDLENKLKSGGSHAGVRIPASAVLNIFGEGSLEAAGGPGGGAGIGGSSGQAAGKITIGKGSTFDPMIEANGGGGGAGIGGGNGGAGGNITINNFMTIARGGSDGGAGIGNGKGVSGGGVITINRGTTEAVGGGSGIGIDGATVSIKDGMITASGRGQALRAGKLNMPSRYDYLASRTNPPGRSDTWRKWPEGKVALKADPAFKYVEIAVRSGRQSIVIIGENFGVGCGAGAGGFLPLVLFFMFVQKNKRGKALNR